jgi:polyhydroxybutyrate depolymerase
MARFISVSWPVIVAIVLTGHAAVAQVPEAAQREWTVAGTPRRAIVVPPRAPSSGAVPAVIVFHGHGGTGGAMARRRFHDHWPEAVVLYPQGLPTATPRDPEGERSGWQSRGDATQNRDLAFFDAMLATLRTEYGVERVCVAGHSNGGGFAYLLAATRGQQIHAIAPVAAGAAGARATADAPLPGRVSVLHIAGRMDRVVPFASQERTIAGLRRLLECTAESTPWRGAADLEGTRWRGADGTAVVWIEHPGGHEVPPGAVESIIRFFRESVPAAEGAPADAAPPRATTATD